MKLHTLSATLLPLLLVAACGSHEPPRTTSDIFTMKTTPVNQAEEAREIDVVATITSSESQAIAAQSDGSVKKLLIHDGDFVRKDQLLAQLDTQVLQAQLARAEADRARAAGAAGRAYAEAANAERKAEIARRMAAVGVSSKADYDDAMAQASGAGAGGAAAAAEEKSAEAQIKETKRLIDAAYLKAPMDGIIANVKFHEGEVPHTGMTIARVFDPTKLQVKFALPRVRRDLVKIGDHVNMTYGTDHKVSATVSEVVDTHDPAIDLLVVIAELDRTSTRPDDLQVGVRGLVHLADKGVAR
jgi:RND family efflux transporter MFP subunit